MSEGDGNGITYALCESVLPAVVIACALEIVKAFGLFGWTDPLFARLVHAGSWTERSEVNAIYNAERKQSGAASERPLAPKIVMIDDDLFVSDFGGESPLNRKKLADLIDQVALRKPKVLAVDLDLSSDPDGNDPVHDVLSKITSSCRGSDAKSSCCTTQFVLIEPFRLHSGGTPGSAAAAANQMACRWVEKITALSSPCIHFARSDIDEVGARAVFFNKAAPTLGVTAFGLVGGDLGREYEGPLKKSEIRVCAGTSSEMGLRTVEAKRPKQLINTRLVAAVEQEHEWRRSGRLEDAGYVTRKANGGDALASIGFGRVVFFGGTWGDADKHVTAARENVDGLVIHAAVFDSLQAPKPERAWLAFPLDIAIGVASGAAFFLLWGRYNARIATFVAGTRAAAIQVTKPGMPSDRILLSAYGSAFAWTCAAWAVFLLSVLVAVQLAVFLLAWGTWMSPAAMVIGMFVHALLSSRPEFGAHSAHSHSPGQAFLHGMSWAGTGLYGAYVAARRGGGWEGAQRLLLSLRWIVTLAIIVIGVAIVGEHTFRH